MQCAAIAHVHLAKLPTGKLYLRIEALPSLAAARSKVTPASVVVEAVGKVWLLTVSAKGEHSSAGTLAAEIGPIPALPSAESYTFDVSEAAFEEDMRPAVSRAVHTHPGPEIFYLFTGHQCLETPSGVIRTGPGEGTVAPANTPMQLNIVGTSKREALFMVLRDSSLPWATPSEWQPKELCMGSSSVR
jgi:hypothetical protein